MEGAVGERYWCHMCSQTVNPVREVALQCPFCLSGFVEEMDSPSRRLDESELASESALALWAPILLGMMSNTSHSRPGRRPHILDENGGDDEENESRELDAALVRRRRRRSSAAVLQLLQGITSEISGESEDSETGRGNREPFILINPFNQTILVQDSEDSSHDRNSDRNPFGSLGDYFIGPGLDLLLQHIAENDPNRYGTAPAQKDAVDALSTVKVGDNLQCPVCLDEFEIQSEAKEMPCKHKFHSGCLLPWLELHSSCPVCRYQLPADESKCDAEVTNGGHENHQSVEEQGGGGSSFSLPWPLNAFSSSSRQRGNSTASSSGGPGATASQADGN